MGLFDIFKPAWQSKNTEKRMNAVAKFRIDNDYSIAKLQKIAEKANFEDVQQAIWKRIAIEAKDWKLREAAVDRLTDQSLLSNIAMNDAYGSIRLTAVERLDDASSQQSLLINILKNVNAFPNNKWLEAVEKIKEEATAQELYACAAMAKDKYLCEKAIEKLTDQMQLAYVAVNGTYSDLYFNVSRSAFEKLKDPLALKYYIENSSNPRAEILDRIHNQKILKSIFENRNNSFEIRLYAIYAINRLSDKEQRDSCINEILLEYGTVGLTKMLLSYEKILINTNPDIWIKYCQAEIIREIMEILKEHEKKSLFPVIQTIYKYRDDLRTVIMDLDGQMISAGCSPVLSGTGDDDGWYGYYSPAKYLRITKESVDTIHIKIYEQEN